MSIAKLAYRLWDNAPAEQLKDLIRLPVRSLMPRRVLRSSRFSDPIVEELARLPVRRAGAADDGVPFLTLDDGISLYGYPPSPTQIFQYGSLPPEIQSKISPQCIRVALDVICRYVYPHADPTVAPPFPLIDRRGFHPQHSDTVQDIPGLTPRDRQAMVERFQIRPGDVILDVGSYIGMGAVRLGRQVGSSGAVVSIEADAAHQVLFARNMTANRVDNAELIRCAAWKSPGRMNLHQQGLQANSLVSGIVRSTDVASVRTDTLDNITRDHRLSKLTLVSLTINGSEPEAIEGMSETLAAFAPKVVAAGWYRRAADPIHKLLCSMLTKHGYQCKVGRLGRVYGWKDS